MLAGRRGGGEAGERGGGVDLSKTYSYILNTHMIISTSKLLMEHLSLFKINPP